MSTRYSDSVPYSSTDRANRESPPSQNNTRYSKADDFFYNADDELAYMKMQFQHPYSASAPSAYDSKFVHQLEEPSHHVDYTAYAPYNYLSTGHHSTSLAPTESGGKSGSKGSSSHDSHMGHPTGVSAAPSGLFPTPAPTRGSSPHGSTFGKGSFNAEDDPISGNHYDIAFPYDVDDMNAGSCSSTTPTTPHSLPTSYFHQTQHLDSQVHFYPNTQDLHTYHQQPDQQHAQHYYNHFNPGLAHAQFPDASIQFNEHFHPSQLKDGQSFRVGDPSTEPHAVHPSLTDGYGPFPDYHLPPESHAPDAFSSAAPHVMMAPPADNKAIRGRKKSKSFSEADDKMGVRKKYLKRSQAVQLAMLDTNFQDDYEFEKKRRNQVKVACVHCKKACKKCDDHRPCSRCIRIGLADSCVDAPRKERKRGFKRGPYNKIRMDGCDSNGEWSPSVEESPCDFAHSFDYMNKPVFNSQETKLPHFLQYEVRSEEAKALEKRTGADENQRPNSAQLEQGYPNEFALFQ